MKEIAQLGRIEAPAILKPFFDKGGSGAGGLGLFLSNLIKLIYTVAGVILVFMIVLSAWEWLTSGGDKEKIAAAKHRIRNAVIGLMLFALAIAVINGLSAFTGFKVF